MGREATVTAGGRGRGDVRGDGNTLDGGSAGAAARDNGGG